MFDKIFNVFSRREEQISLSGGMPLTPEFRNRVIMLLRDELQSSFVECLSQLHNKLTYLHGKFQLNEAASHRNDYDDALEFIGSCKDEQFLDVIELMFNSGFSGIFWPDNRMIPAINDFLQN